MASPFLMRFIHDPPRDHSALLVPVASWFICVSRSSLCPREPGAQDSGRQFRFASTGWVAGILLGLLSQRETGKGGWSL